MSEIWENTFARVQRMWGDQPTASALIACDRFEGAREVLIPGVGYGRNARPFLERGMRVTGIEISETAIKLAREQGLSFDIHHGSVTDMPFDAKRYDAIFCFGLLYLLDAPGRAKLLRDCASQLAPGGAMFFTVISKDFEAYGQGTKLAEDWYETHPGMRLFFYDPTSITREFAPYGALEISEIAEPMHDGTTRPFLNVLCRPGR